MSFIQKYPAHWFHISGKPYPEFPDWRQLGDMYGEYMDAIDEYRAYYVSKRTSSLNLETVNLTTNMTGTGTFYNSKLNLQDGSVYYPTYQGYEGFRVTNDLVDGLTSGNGLYALDTCLSPVDGKIYVAPYSTVNIVSQDVHTFTAAVEANTTGNWLANQYSGSVVADDGSIHFLPSSNYNEACKYDYSTVTYYGNASTSTNNAFSFQAGVNLDGIFYMPPVGHVEGSWYVRKIDPVTETITDIELFASTNSFTRGWCVPYKNYILFQAAEDGAGFACRFDTTDNSYTAVSPAMTISSLATKGFLGPDGCYYYCEGAAGNLWRTDIEAGTTTNLGVQLFNILGLTSSGYVIGCRPNPMPNGVYFTMKLFDVPIDPNFLCNRYLNTT